MHLKRAVENPIPYMHVVKYASKKRLGTYQRPFFFIEGVTPISRLLYGLGMGMTTGIYGKLMSGVIKEATESIVA